MHVFDIVLLDDNAADNSILEAAINGLCEREGIGAAIALSTTNISDVIRHARSNGRNTAYFLDINLNDTMDGIDAAKLIYEYDPNGLIVFVTAYSQYAIRCCRAHAFDFILKPFNEPDLCECLHAIEHEFRRKSNATQLLITISPNRSIMVDCDDIKYIAVEKNRLTAHTTQGALQWRGSLSDVLKRLNEKVFLQINRNIIVNTKYISEINTNDDVLKLMDQTVLPISRRCKKNLKGLYLIWGS